MPSDAMAEKLSVYLVDDNLVLRRGVAALVNAQSDMAVCGETSSPRLAFRQVRRIGPRVAIIDLRFQECIDTELIRRLRTGAPGLRILVFSACDERTHAAETLAAGASGYVMKNETPESLIAAVRRIARKPPPRLHAGEIRAVGRRWRPWVRRARPGGLRRVDTEIMGLIGRGTCATAIACHLHLTVAALHAYTSRIRRILCLRDKTKFVAYCACWARKGGDELAAGL